MAFITNQEASYTKDMIYISPYSLHNPIMQQPVTIHVPMPKKTGKAYGCYKKDSDDSRCCGFCYHFYPPNKSNNIRCEICTNGIYDHCRSGYIYTDDAGCNNDDDFAGCYCIICFPFKIGIFSPCLLGSIFNSCLNSMCKTNKNYLF